MADRLFPVHAGYAVKSFLPGHREPGRVCIACPRETGQPVEDQFTPLFEPRQRPGDAGPEFSVLAAAGAGDLSAVCIVTGDLASREVSVCSLSLYHKTLCPGARTHSRRAITNV